MAEALKPEPYNELSSAYVGDMERMACRIEFLALRPDPVRFGWVCVCTKRTLYGAPMSYEDALEGMREHMETTHPKGEEDEYVS